MRTSLNGAPFSSSMSSEPLRLVPTRVTHGIVLCDGSLTLRVLIAERRRCRCSGEDRTRQTLPQSTQSVQVKRQTRAELRVQGSAHRLSQPLATQRPSHRLTV